MSCISAEMAARRMGKEELKSASSHPGQFGGSHSITASEAISILMRESQLRSKHKLWRK